MSSEFKQAGIGAVVPVPAQEAAMAGLGQAADAYAHASAPVSAQEAAMAGPELVIVTGMSGAGRTEAMHAFEDLGYFCIDNLPARLFKHLLTLEGMPGQASSHRRIAVVCDARNRDFFESFTEELARLDEQGVRYRLLFLDADDAKLVARYKSSRRRHPLCENGMTIGQGIMKERSLLFDVRESAHELIDTTDMLPQQLRSTIQALFTADKDYTSMAVTVFSFGFKHGAALDADIVMDVRFLPNPYYDPALRPLTGLDAPVRDFVMYRSETEDFLRAWNGLLDCVMPGYVNEGKQQFAIAIGCTGGQHRSVALAEATGEYLKAKGYRVSVAHRDLALAAGMPAGWHGAAYASAAPMAEAPAAPSPAMPASVADSHSAASVSEAPGQAAPMAEAPAAPVPDAPAAPVAEG